MDLPISGSGERSTSIPDFNSPLFQRGRNALRLLYEAHCFAEQHDGSAWDFAEEITSLRQLGMMNSDLRWLVCIGHVEHGHEITKIGEEHRKFQSDKGLHFSKDTCFVLTDLGASHVRGFLIEPAQDQVQQIEAGLAAAIDSYDPLKPSWNRDLQELRLGNTIVKRFKVPAPNQEMILAVFHEEKWPAYIDDPLPPHPDFDPKRRLRDTINSLNRNQKNKLIHFRGNGSGDGVRWEFVPSSKSTKSS